MYLITLAIKSIINKHVILLISDIKKEPSAAIEMTGDLINCMKFSKV